MPQNGSGNINGNGTTRSGGATGSGGIGPSTNMLGPLFTFNPIVEILKSCNRITKRFKLKIYEIYTSFNVSPMKAYKRPMYK
jgi:hypothetical protein